MTSPCFSRRHDWIWEMRPMNWHRENFGFQNSKRNVYCITCLLYKPFDRPDDWLYKTALPDGRSNFHSPSALRIFCCCRKTEPPASNHIVVTKPLKLRLLFSSRSRLSPNGTSSRKSRAVPAVRKISPVGRQFWSAAV